MSNLSTLPKGDSAWLLRKAIERIMQQVSVLETNIGSSTTGNSANTQIIFNDAGTLRGDAGLTYDKTIDALYVGGLFSAGSASVGPGGTLVNALGVLGSATITGDLTVATDAFKVISATKDVCIGTVTPTFNNKLTVVGGSGGDAFVTSGNGTRTGYIGTDGTTVIMGGYSNHTLRIHANDLPQMQISPLGIFDWYDGAASPGTRMTLNSTGLGIGGSPVNPLTVFAAASAKAPALLLGTVGSPTYGWDFSVDGATNGNLFIRRLVASVKTDVLEFDRSSGNVGVGVTPSAWGAGTSVIDLNTAGSAAALSSSGTLSIANNAFFNGTDWKYKNTNTALLYQLISGQHSWFTAASGTAGATITDFATAKMVLDASGNLLVGITTSTTERLRIVGNSANDVSCFISPTGGSGVKLLRFAVGAGAGTEVGSISYNGGLGVNYTSLSDYRLKESVKPLSEGLARVNALKPSSYKFKLNGSNGEGFLAHELSEVVPAAVTGEKDAMNKDGSINPQGVDMSRIVPILVAAIQELTARVQILEAR